MPPKTPPQPLPTRVHKGEGLRCRKLSAKESHKKKTALADRGDWQRRLWRPHRGDEAGILQKSAAQSGAAADVGEAHFIGASAGPALDDDAARGDVDDARAAETPIAGEIFRQPRIAAARAAPIEARRRRRTAIIARRITILIADNDTKLGGRRDDRAGKSTGGKHGGKTRLCQKLHHRKTFRSIVGAVEPPSPSRRSVSGITYTNQRRDGSKCRRQGKRGGKRMSALAVPVFSAGPAGNRGHWRRPSCPSRDGRARRRRRHAATCG
ncbi:hypothetical protein RHE_CH02936 [Rhizobium etli CFN 42]|uniref:Uncharacterized protein n=1 Tax=Rhizobium etli (strain ATCC 51251 / DSM 11541 / JCM 21823 / NBRC 15573 / CFN 42) TaxID=347834 RepID=Q2K633_RHIEC|nr:hypothetical protein RHE_CH02936 [Rhizobium etli CFN 42]